MPKRRGPDKRPGTRKRSCKKRQSDGSDPQPKKKQRADPVDQGTSAHPAYNQYEIAPVAVPMFGSAQHKSSKVDIEPPTASLTAWTLPIHQRGYHRQLRHSRHRHHIPQRAKFSQGSHSLTPSSPISALRNLHTRNLRLPSQMRRLSRARIMGGGKTFLILTRQHVSKRM